jgi:hypothetical protein
MRTIIAVLMMCLLCGHPLVTAAEPTGGVLLAAGIREAARLGSLELVTAQAVTPNKRSGHPVLIGAAIGAGAGALLGYFGTTCSEPPPFDDMACGTRYKEGGAIVGAGLRAGVGALIGLAFGR